MKMILDNILSRNDVVKEFYNSYEIQIFKEWILKEIPEVEEARILEQDNPWHIYNCLDHILHSVEEMNKQTKDLDPKVRRLLAYTMFFHDLGKPATKIRRYSKLYKKEVDSFFKHNLKSVEIANRCLEKLGFDKEEQKLIKLLIKEHDMFMFITLKSEDKYHRFLTKEYLNEVINDFNGYGNGLEILNYLIMIGRADNLSQNPEMTKDSLLLISEMEKMRKELIDVRK